LGAGKPHRAWHLALRQHAAMRCRRFQVEIIPDALPEGLEVANRPLPKIFVIAKRQAAFVLEPAAVERELGGSGFRHDHRRLLRAGAACRRRAENSSRKAGEAGTNAAACDLIAQARIEAQEDEDAQASLLAVLVAP